jgi:ABC-type oligopeptide transport system ATPase subunit
VNKNNLAISSLAMDLKRVAIGYHRGSSKMANRFSEEALKRKEELELSQVKPYLRKFIKAVPKILKQKDKEKIAEDALMYSVILENYVVHNSSSYRFPKT